MLIEFSVTNYRSIKDKQTLSMAAGSSRSVRAHHSHKTKSTRVPYVLRAAAMFGANGSGKSNLISAMQFFQAFVLTSATDRPPGDKLAIAPYKLSKSTVSSPTEMEMVFEIDGDIYQLGFKVNQHRVLSEWLYVTQKGQPVRVWLDREFLEEGMPERFWISPSLPGAKSVWKSSTRSDALLFSTAVHLNAAPLKPAFEWLKEKLHIIATNMRIDPEFTAGLMDGPQGDQVLRFLKDVGIDVEAIESYESDMITAEDLQNIRPDLRSYVENEMLGKKRKKLICIHKDEDGESVPFAFEDESDGTQALISFAGPWIDVAENGITVIVDELHNSLHPFALRYLIENYFTSVAGANGGQLIYTTHDTYSMEAAMLHRDQVWLVERGQTGGTRLVPLSDYSVRSNESYRTGYLRGRYGGVPQTGPRTVGLSKNEGFFHPSDRRTEVN